ncbi:MAG TPA: ABC transporter substrate-binding protein [Firmicutes bacterium]|nr:ABC transporter substrate-binding protein [Bacillota bacterium]HHY98774.1 ABC transporter substrate-binding protein [Bacillota bacterium]
MRKIALRSLQFICTLGLILILTSVAFGATRLTFWHGFGGTEGDKLTQLVDRWNKNNPDIRVEIIYIPYDQLLHKALAGLAGGETPDLLQLDLIAMPQFTRSGKVVNLDGYIENSRVDMKDFYPSLLEYDYYNGHCYALPLTTNNLGLMWNKDMFRRAGLDPEVPPRYWDELIKYAQKLNNPGKMEWGFVQATEVGVRGEGITWEYMIYLWQNRGEFMVDNYSKPAFNSKEGIEALQFKVDLIHKYKVSPVRQIQGGFLTGKVGMALQGPWMLQTIREQAIVDFGTAFAPYPKDGKPASNIGGEHVCIIKSNPERERAAWKFLNWLISPDTMVDWFMGTGYVPVRKSILTNPRYQKWLKDEEPKMRPFIEQQQYARPRPPIPQYAAISYAFAVEVEKTYLGKSSPAQVLKAAEDAVIKIMKAK